MSNASIVDIQILDLVCGAIYTLEELPTLPIRAGIIVRPKGLTLIIPLSLEQLRWIKHEKHDMKVSCMKMKFTCMKMKILLEIFHG